MLIDIKLSLPSVVLMSRCHIVWNGEWTLNSLKCGDCVSKTRHRYRFSRPPIPLPRFYVSSVFCTILDFCCHHCSRNYWDIPTILFCRARRVVLEYKICDDFQTTLEVWNKTFKLCPILKIWRMVDRTDLRNGSKLPLAALLKSGTLHLQNKGVSTRKPPKLGLPFSALSVAPNCCQHCDRHKKLLIADDIKLLISFTAL